MLSDHFSAFYLSIDSCDYARNWIFCFSRERFLFWFPCVGMENDACIECSNQLPIDLDAAHCALRRYENIRALYFIRRDHILTVICIQIITKFTHRLEMVRNNNIWSECLRTNHFEAIEIYYSAFHEFPSTSSCIKIFLRGGVVAASWWRHGVVAATSIPNIQDHKMVLVIEWVHRPCIVSILYPLAHFDGRTKMIFLGPCKTARKTYFKLNDIMYLLLQ